MPAPNRALPMRSTISVLALLRLSTSLPNSTLPDRPNAQPSSVSSKPCCLRTAICAGVRPLGGAVWHPPRARNATSNVINMKRAVENKGSTPVDNVCGGGLRIRRLLAALGQAFGLVHRRIGGIEQGAGSGAMIGVDGNADTEGGQHLGVAGHPDRRVHAGNDLVGDTLGILRFMQWRQQHRELITAQ